MLVEEFVKEFKEINKDFFNIIENYFHSINKGKTNTFISKETEDDLKELTKKLEQYNKSFKITKKMSPSINFETGETHYKLCLNIQGEDFLLTYNKHYTKNPDEEYFSFSFSKKNIIINNDSILYYHYINNINNKFEIETKDIEFKPVYLEIKINDSKKEHFITKIHEDYKSSNEFKNDFNSGKLSNKLNVLFNLNLESINRLNMLSENIINYEINILNILLADKKEIEKLNDYIEIEKLSSDFSDLENFFKEDQIIGKFLNYKKELNFKEAKVIDGFLNYKEELKINKKESFLNRSLSFILKGAK